MNKIKFLVVLLSVVAISATAQIRVTIGDMTTRANFDDTSEDIVLTLNNDIAKISGAGGCSYAEMPLIVNATMKIDFTNIHDAERSSTDNKISVTPSLQDGGFYYSTLYAPYNLLYKQTTDITVYTATYDKVKNQVEISAETKVEPGTVIPLGTGIVIQSATPGATVTFEVAQEEGDKDCSSVLTGTVTAIPLSYFNPKHVYTLSKLNDNVAFYHYVALRTKPCKAFLLESDEMNLSSKALSFVFDDGLSTGVSLSSDAKTSNSGIAYNVLGQRVNPNTRGIIIKNGKKYIGK